MPLHIPEKAQFPSEGRARRGLCRGRWSDHWSFRQEGYDAIMVTDTATFGTPTTTRSRKATPDTLDYERMARVSMGSKNTAGPGRVLLSRGTGSLAAKPLEQRGREDVCVQLAISV